METFPQPDLSSELPELDMLMHEQYLLWPIDAGTPILKSRSKMADQMEITGFLILNIIWEPFSSQISAVSNLCLTCLCMNNICYGLLMYLASF